MHVLFRRKSRRPNRKLRRTALKNDGAQSALGTGEADDEQDWFGSIIDKMCLVLVGSKPSKGGLQIGGKACGAKTVNCSAGPSFAKGKGSRAS